MNESTRSANPADDKDKVVKLEYDGKIDEGFLRFQPPVVRTYTTTLNKILESSGFYVNITDQGDNVFRYTRTSGDTFNFSNLTPGVQVRFAHDGGGVASGERPSAANIGQFKLVAGGSNWFEVENPNGVAESGKRFLRINMAVVNSLYEWEKPARLAYIEVEVQGGGGGSAVSWGGSSGDYGGAGGGGGYAKKTFFAGDLPSVVEVEVGAGGFRGERYLQAFPGQESKFLSVIGGGGQPGSTASGSNSFGAGGTASGGDINITGSDGEQENEIVPTRGGASALSPGSTNGYGGGAGSSLSMGSTSTPNNGRDGGNGIVIITEHYL